MLWRVIALLVCGSAAALAASSPAPALLGMELGRPIDWPNCGSGAGTFSARLCVNAALTHRTAWGAIEHQVALPRNDVPPYVRGQVKVVTIDGVIESIQIGTWGLQSQDGAAAAAAKQFGPPTRTRQGRRAPNSRFVPRFEEWDFPEYAVRVEGTSGSIDWGLIEISTHRYRKLAQAQEKRETGR